MEGPAIFGSSAGAKFLRALVTWFGLSFLVVASASRFYILQFPSQPSISQVNSDEVSLDIRSFQPRVTEVEHKSRAICAKNVTQRKEIQQDTGEKGSKVFPESVLRRLQDVESQGSFQFLDTQVLSFRRDMLFGKVFEGLDSDAEIHYVDLSRKDERIFFQLGRYATYGMATGSSNDSDPGAVTLLFDRPTRYTDIYSFTFVDMELYGGQGRFLVYGDEGSNSLVTVALDSHKPPFPSWRLPEEFAMTGFDTIASDPTHPYLYISTRGALFRLTLPLYLNESVTLERLPFAANVSAGVQVSQKRLSRHAISADRKLLYASSCADKAIFRLRLGTGEAEKINGLVELDCPDGLALTADGCNLISTEKNAGRIQLINFASPGGAVNYIYTLVGSSSSSQATRSSSLPFTGIAMSPEGSLIYVGSKKSIYEFAVNKSTLPSCNSRITPSIAPPSEGSSVPNHPSSRSKKTSTVTIVVSVLGAFLGVLGLGGITVKLVLNCQRSTLAIEDRPATATS
ncbi:hypothetical protein CBR_g49398 [Chara braunii]|uniref:Uncharacterized protein n=1 Tax=Chara braunii TaxID=69332 RepID=A0A388M4V0_CHABU|nr:hypothetical protein CBR_g49398 [Chara braunii]|eukprot:GBG89608.1 hypothetical protein CBR_g49398 [Chara braunii]